MDTGLNPGIFWLYHIYDDYSVSGTQRHTYKRFAQRDYEPNNPHKHPRNISRWCRVPVKPS